MTKKKETTGDYEVNELLADLMGESDRAAVILAAAKIDGLLTLLLKHFLRPNPASRDELLESDSPLSTFSAKINISYRLGLVDDHLSRSLHCN